MLKFLWLLWVPASLWASRGPFLPLKLVQKYPELRQIVLIHILPTDTYCGGRLSAGNRIETMAHCFKDYDSGEYDPHSSIEIYVAASDSRRGLKFVLHRTISSIHVHENFGSEIEIYLVAGKKIPIWDFSNDEASLQLSEDLNVESDSLSSIVPRSHELILTVGFCKKHSETIAFKPILERLRVSDWIEKYRRFVAINSGHASCGGDSGGPAYVIRNGRAIFIGLRQSYNFLDNGEQIENFRQLDTDY